MIWWKAFLCTDLWEGLLVWLLKHLRPLTKVIEERTSDIKASDNDQRYVPDMRLCCNCLSLDTMSQAGDGTMRRSVQGCWPGHYTRLNTTRILSDKLYLHGVERINSLKYQCCKTDPRCQKCDIHLTCLKCKQAQKYPGLVSNQGWFLSRRGESLGWVASPWEVPDLRRQEMVTIKTSSAVPALHRQADTDQGECGDKPQIVKI